MKKQSTHKKYKTIRIVTINVSLIAAIFTSAISYATTPWIGHEQLSNSGMEDGDIHWHDWTAHTMVTSPVHSGNRAMQYTHHNWNAGVQHNISINSTYDYTISLWSKSETGMKGYAAQYFFKDDNNTVLKKGFVGEHTSNAGWVKHQATVTPPENTTKMSLNLLGNSINANLWFDDISVRPFQIPPVVEPPTPDNTNTPPVPGNWVLTFEDEFSGNLLNPNKWRVGGHYLGVGNSKAGNSSDNIIVRNGNAELIAEKKPIIFGSKQFDYTSSEISTFQNFRQAYGYFEARIKHDTLPGGWPAFWVQPDRGNYGNENLILESFLRFDLSGFDQPVIKALLKVKVIDIEKTTDTNVETQLSNISVHKLLSTEWHEDDVNWNNKPAYDSLWLRQFSGSDDAGLINEISIGNDLVIDVTGYINTQLAANKNAGFAIVDTFMKNNNITFGSKELTNVGDRPRLEIDGSSISPTDDTFVKAGNQALTNFADQSVLEVRAPYAQTSHTWDGGAEIDIMESQGVWGANGLQHATHWKEYSGGPRQSIHSDRIHSISTSDGYHTYGMNWEPGRIEFYIDGNISDVFEDEKITYVSAYILLSHYLGGWDSGWNNGVHVDGYDNSIVRDDLLPATMYVDYVRVWKKSSQ